MTTGLEPIFTVAQGNFHSDADALVCAVHWCLVCNGFRTIGCGEVAPEDLSQTSELLPSGWNQNSDCYSLYYVSEHSTTKDTDIYVLKAIPVDSTLLTHFMRSSDEQLTNTTILIADFCSGDYSSFKRCYQNTEELSARIKSEIISPLIGKTRTEANQSKQNVDNEKELKTKEPLRDHSSDLQIRRRYPQRIDPVDPFSFGHRDLDPFSRGYGGMVMDPFRSGMQPHIDPSTGISQRLPRGSVPGGARFDPFGPPDVDHLGQYGNVPNRRTDGRSGFDDPPPPDFEDDLYM